MPRSPGRPANDNEDPDESWRRAELILKANSGLDLASADEERLAITQLVTDILHYCEVMSLGKRSDHPDYLDFDKLVDVAIQHYNVQSHSMNSVMDQRLGAMRAERETTRPQGEPSMPQDTEFTAKVPFTQDPEFIKLQRDIQLRQEQERKELEKQQTEQRIDFGRQPGVTREQLDDNYKRQLQEREAQSKTQKAETDRYTRDYHDAKVLREEMRENEKREALERGLDPDKPKLTR